MTAQLNGRWEAAKFFEELTLTNKLAQSEQFVFCRVSGLDGFEEAVNSLQTTSAFVCVSDIADGYTELNNTPRTRRIKTVFFAMRHAAEDMSARAECMEIMRELFRQFASRLILEKTRLEQSCIYIDPRISFNEIDRYFFNGAAAAYFQIAVDVFTDLRFRREEWEQDFWLVSFGQEKIKCIALVRSMSGNTLSLVSAKNIVESAPCILEIVDNSKTPEEWLADFRAIGATVELR